MATRDSTNQVKEEDTFKVCASAPGAFRTMSLSTLLGKRAAVVLYSTYPSDPRPRRAAEALVEEGMVVDLICLTENEKENRKDKDHDGARLALLVTQQLLDNSEDGNDNEKILKLIQRAIPG